MDGLGPLLILLAVLCVLSGPVALIVGLVAMKKMQQLQRDLHDLAAPGSAKPVRSAPIAERGPATPIVPAKPEPVREIRPQIPAQAPAVQAEPQRGPVPPVSVSLEQRIGTRWVLIAGVITVIFAVGFFLKYAYDQQWIGPLGRVLIAGIAGLVALAVGEVTRRRGYDIVAKGVTALGFSILYAMIFATHRWYGLIGPAPAFALAIGVTTAAMLYAVALDEIIIAMLSLVGGYLTPVVLATGQNHPNLLFGYVLILSAGAMLCAQRRKWSAVNILAFLGAYLLYTGWFEQFYRPAMVRETPPEQLVTALLWLMVFFLVYLTLPLLHTLARRVKSASQDMLLVLANAAVVLYYLWTILNRDYRGVLALCSVGMGTAHLAMAGLVIARRREDSNLWQALLVVGLAFITLAVPLYFEVYAVAMLWGIEGLLLAAVGLRYRSLATQLAGAVVLALVAGDLLTSLPMHIEPFRAVFNTAFGTWCFVAAVVTVCHVLYRLDRHLDPNLRSMSVQGLYIAGLGLLIAAITMELWWHGKWNMPAGSGKAFFGEQMVLVFAAFIPLLVVRPICPRGQAGKVAGTSLAAIASVYTLVTFPGGHGRDFVIFFNVDFARAILLIAVLFASAWQLRRAERREPDAFVASGFVALGAILVLWILLTQEIWLYYDRLRPRAQWRFLAQMYISILWAVYATALMVVGFWRRVRPLRYIALGIFLLLLGKIFLIDTRQLETIYRIFGFLVTGLALVGVSYLYQHLKKTGFFETMLTEKDTRTGSGGSGHHA